jgi:hypothetical protein
MTGRVDAEELMDDKVAECVEHGYGSGDKEIHGVTIYGMPYI